MANNQIYKKPNSKFNPPTYFVVGQDDDEYNSPNIDDEGNLRSRLLIWNVNTLDWEAATTGVGVGEHVEVQNFPASYAVTGAFWQATQPVSGTFWQATQPVSGEITNDPLSTWVSGSLTLTLANTVYLIPAVEQVGRRQLVLYNGSTSAIFVGSSAVTVATGIQLIAGGTMTLDAGAGLYAICADAGKILNYLEGK